MVKYTDEQISAAVDKSTTVSQVLRELGVKYLSGGMHSHISRRIQRLELDTSHFLGQAHWKGFKKPAYRLSADQILVNRRLGNRRQHTYHLRRALLEVGKEEVCSKCGVAAEWQDNILVLEIDHINNDPLDDRRENLRFLCPNCHSQRGRGEIC